MYSEDTAGFRGCGSVRFRSRLSRSATYHHYKNSNYAEMGLCSSLLSS